MCVYRYSLRYGVPTRIVLPVNLDLVLILPAVCKCLCVTVILEGLLEELSEHDSRLSSGRQQESCLRLFSFALEVCVSVSVCVLSNHTLLCNILYASEHINLFIVMYFNLFPVLC